MNDRSNREQRGLGTLILGPSQESTDSLCRQLAKRSDLEAYKVIQEYPELHHLVRLINAYQPELVFLEIGKDQAGLKVARNIQAASQTTVIIGFGDEFEPSQLEGAVQAGMADLLRLPLTSQRLDQAIGKALEIERTRAHNNVIAFLPAKAGSGATTASFQTAAALAREWKKKVLLIEADLHSGLLPMLLKLSPQRSIVDALELSDSLDDQTLKELVIKVHGLDLLPTPLVKSKSRFSRWEYHRLLAFVSPRYDFVVVDLPEVVNDATEAIVTRASRVHIVCTAEQSSTFLAGRRIYELAARMVKDERLHVLLNRHQEGDSLDEIEEVIGRKLAGVLPNDYANVQAANTEGRRVDANSELGRAYRLFSAGLAGIELSPKSEAARAARAARKKSAASKTRRVSRTCSTGSATARPGKRRTK
jgi:pilus assembly protein CpaE